MRPPRNGNYTRRRGYEFEREFCAYMNEGGVLARRHFMSGLYEKGDCTLTASRLKGQLKRKKKLPAWLGLEGHDFCALRGDRGETHVVITAELFRKLLARPA